MEEQDLSDVRQTDREERPKEEGGKEHENPEEAAEERQGFMEESGEETPG
jgi:hypothetical protein